MRKKIKKFKKVYVKIVKFSFVFLMVIGLVYNPSSNIPQAHAAVQTIVLNYNQTILTEGTSWTVPADWVSGTNTVEVIGGGGSGWTNTAGTATGSGGGGGGGYSKISNLALTPGATVTYKIGDGGTYGAVNGGVTYFNWTAGSTTDCTGTVSVCANGGLGATSATGAAGGSTTNAKPAAGGTLLAGGAGGTGGPATALTSGGGGGAGGPVGAGKAGGNGYQTATAATGGGGGGGNGGTSSTAGVIGTTAGGNGGIGDAGAAGGTGGNAGAATNGTGSGAGGGGSDGGLNGGHGANGNIATMGSVGPGGGGGGAGTRTTAVGQGGNGGLYGAGGGGGRFGGRGALGVIIITNNGVTPTRTTWTVPSDWNSANNSIEVIGAGGSSYTATVGNGEGGGGGGAYSKATNVTLTPGGTVGYSIGQGGRKTLIAAATAGVNGGDTYFCNATGANCTAITGSAVVAGAKGGLGSTSATGAAGGASASGFPAAGTRWSGGAGGAGSTAGDCGGGGGGAGSVTQAGKAGGICYATGSGGGGGGGGAGDDSGTDSTVGSAGVAANGGAGGYGPTGVGGGFGAAGANTFGGNAPAGSGSGGGGGDTPFSGGNGGSGSATNYGGGGGGGTGDGNSVATGSLFGGDGGNFGGGGGGGVQNGFGGNGVIIITYTPAVPPVVTTTVPVATSITDTTAVLNGSITDITGGAPTVRGFDYGTDPTLVTGTTTTVENGGTAEDFEGNLLPFPPTGWTTGGSVNWARDTTTTYGGSAGSAASGSATPDNGTTWLSYTKTFAQAGQVSFYWSVSSEATFDFLSFCLDLNATCSNSVHTGTYTISGTVGWTLVTVPVSAGTHDFRWLYGKDVSGVTGSDKGWVDNIQFTEGFGVGAYTSNALTNLSCGTTYYARAYANNGVTGSGSIVSFSTGTCVAPSVTTPTVTAITPNSATLGANVTAQGDSTITVRGTCWDITPNPTANCVAEGGTTTGIFTHSRTGLPIGTLIYYRGYATNLNGNTGYSPDGSFSTTGSATLSLGKATDGWSGAIPVYATLSVITNVQYPYARAKVTTIAGAVFYTPMTWSVGNSRFEGVIYPGSNICMGCEDPKTYNGSFSVVLQLDDTTGFPSIDYNSSAQTFTIFMTTKRSSMDAVANTNYTDFNSIWTVDHWATSIKDFGFAMRSGTGTNVAVAIPIHPVTSSPTNFTVAFNAVSVSPGTAASTGVNAWWWEATSHTLYVQFASLSTTLVDVDITFDTDTDLFATRYNWTQSFDMGQRSGSNGLYIANRYLTTFIYPRPPSLADNNVAPVSANESEQTGIQAESRAHLDGGADQSTDCMERVAVHVDGTALADTSTGAYDKDIKWDPEEYASWITSETNSGFTIVEHSDATAVSGTTGGWAQQLSNGITATRTQNYFAGKRYIKNQYDFYNGGGVAHSYPMVWEREQWHGTDRQTNDAGRFANNPSVDVVMEQRVSPSGWAKFWQTAYDKVTFINGGMIWDKNNLPDFQVFAVEPFLGGTTPFYEWPIVITASHATQTTDQTGFEKTWASVAPGATVSFTFYHEHNAETSWANIQASMDADETEINAATPPAFTQSSYRWRNDNDNELNASYPVEENTPLTGGVYIGDKRRLRVAITNTGTSTASSIPYRLEYSSGLCTVWAQVPAAGDNSGPWVMANSSYATDSSATTDSSYVTNPANKTFVAGKLMTATSQAPILTLTNAQFTDLEYSIAPTSNVTTGLNYCFRVTNAGDATAFTYAAQPQIFAYNSIFIPRTGGGSVEAPSAAPGVGVGGGGGGGVGGSGGSTTAGGIAVLIANAVSSVTITAGGSGYVTPPSVSFCGGGGSGAAGTAVLLGGAVTDVTMSNGGANYTSLPTVVFGGTCGGAGGGAGGGDSGFINGKSRYDILASANASGYKIWDVVKYLFNLF
jgi:hypothetical protein